MSFNIPIRIDSAGTSAAIAKVTTELDRAERAGKAAGQIVSKALASGALTADQAKDATVRYTRALADAERQADALRGKAQGMGSAFSGAFAGIKGSITSAFGGLTEAIGNIGLAGNAISGFASGLVTASEATNKLSDDLINMRNLLRTTTDSQSGLASAVGKTQALANLTLTGTAETTDAYVRLSHATRDLGLTEDHVLRLTQTMAEKFAMSGKSAQEQTAAMLQLSQAMGSGVLAGDEFKSLSENMPDLLRVFAKELGVSRGELKELASQGKITTDIMIKGLDGMADATDRAFAGLERTSTQKQQVMKNLLTTDPEAAFKSMLTGPGASNQAAKIRDQEALEVSDFNKKIGETVDAYERLHQAQAAFTGHTIFTEETVASFDKQLEAMFVTAEKFKDPAFWINKQAEELENLKDGAFDASLAFERLADIGIGGVIAKLGVLATGIDEPMAKLQTHVSELAKAMFGSDVAQRGAWDSTANAKGTGGTRAKKARDTSWDNTFSSQSLERNSLSSILSGTGDQLGSLGSISTAMQAAQAEFGGLITQGKKFIDFTNEMETGGATLTGVFRDLAVAAGVFDPWDPDKLERIAKGNELTKQFTREATTGFREMASSYDEFLARTQSPTEKAFGNMLKQATDVSGALESLFTNAYQGIENSIVQLATTGKASFSDLVNGIMADLTRLATRKLFMSLIGAFGGGGGGYSIGGSSQAPGLSFATGGAFRVGGDGGRDTTPVQFNATRGEVVTISNERQQSEAAKGSNAAPNVNIVHNVSLDRRELLSALESREGATVIATVIRSNPGLMRSVFNR